MHSAAIPPVTRRGLLLGLLAATAWLALGLAAVAQTTISVLQTNIHRDIGASDSNTSAQPHLAQEVNFFSPDIWTIQELGGNSVGFNITTATNSLVAFVQSNLTIYGPTPVQNTDFYVYVATRNDGYETTAIVSRYPILNASTYSDSGGGYQSLRGLARVTVDIPGDTNLDIFTMHLKALNDDTSAGKRQAEAAANSATIGSWIASHPSDAVIVTGDFNETSEASASANWSGHRLGDTITLANGTTAIYNPVAKLLAAGLKDPRPTSRNGSLSTISSSKPTSRFDYILYGPNARYLGGQAFNSALFSTSELAAMNAKNGTTLTTSTSALASDHLAVFSTFSIVPEPGTLVLLTCAGGILAFRAWRRATS
jgi:endonuclease/exonuclease/phosphatase family metal-dependent hydrolase